jgi:uncharacterized membrane protein YoaK (UPF0700 family)
MLPFILSHILVCILITGVAVRLSKKRDAYIFYVALFAAWLLASILLSCFGFGELTLRSALAASLWCLTIAVVYAVVFGRLVVSGSSVITIWVSSFLILIVQIPLSFISAIYIGCYVGHSCP